MRMLISSLLLASLLAACQPVAPIMPVPDSGGTGPRTTEALPSANPTATQTPTPEPTPTQAPTETPTPAEFKDAQAFLGDGFEVRPDGTVFDKTKNQEIPGLTIVPFNKDTMIKTGGPSDPEPAWAWQRVYEFKDKKDFTVNGTAYDLQILPNSGLDMYAWKYEEGEFTREKIAFPTKTSKTIDMDAYSPSEVQYMIVTDSSTNPDNRGRCDLGFARVISRTVVYKKPINENGKWSGYITYSDMYSKLVSNQTMWGNNFIPTQDKNGNWQETGTATYLIYTMENRNMGLVVWYGKDDKPIVTAVEGKYIDVFSLFNLYWSSHNPQFHWWTS